MSGGKLFHAVRPKCPVVEMSPGMRHNEVSTGCVANLQRAARVETVVTGMHKSWG